MQTPTKKAALYSRCSTDIQRDKGFTIPRQKEWLAEEAKRRGFKHFEHYVDNGFSSWDTNRPEYRRMLDDIEQGKIQAVITYKCDRLERNTIKLLKLVDYLRTKKVELISMSENLDTTDANGQLFLTMIGAIGQWERQTVVERVKDAMWDKARKGDFCGGQPPYGYDVKDKKLVVNEKEADAIKDIFEHFIQTKSFRSTCHYMNLRGYKTKKGKAFASSSVKRFLSNPVYTGYQTFGKRMGEEKKFTPENEWLVVKAQLKPIISEETFKQAQNIIRQRKFKRCEPKGRNYLLTGIIRCPKCGGSMYGSHQTRKGKEGWYYYKCHNNSSKGRAVCEGNTLRMFDVDEAVLKALIDHSRNILLQPEQMKQAIRSEKKNDPISDLQKDIQKEREKQKRIYETKTDGVTPKHLYEEQMRASIKRLENFELRLSELTDEKEPKIIQRKKNLFDRVYSLQEGFFELPKKEKHKIVQELIKVVFPSEKKGIKIEFYEV